MATKVNLGMIEVISVEEVNTSDCTNVKDVKGAIESAIVQAATNAQADNQRKSGRGNVRALSVFPFEGKLYVMVGSGAFL